MAGSQNLGPTDLGLKLSTSKGRRVLYSSEMRERYWSGLKLYIQGRGGRGIGQDLNLDKRVRIGYLNQ